MGLAFRSVGFFFSVARSCFDGMLRWMNRWEKYLWRKILDLILRYSCVLRNYRSGISIPILWWGFTCCTISVYINTEILRLFRTVSWVVESGTRISQIILGNVFQPHWVQQYCETCVGMATTVITMSHILEAQLHTKPHSSRKTNHSDRDSSCDRAKYLGWI